LSVAAAAQLALQLLIGLIHRLAASHQHSNEILDILCAGAGAGVAVAVDVLAEATYRHQAEVAAPKSVCVTPRKALHNPINRLRSRWVILWVVRVVVEVKILL
jgi:hypothetical protein